MSIQCKKMCAEGAVLALVLGVAVAMPAVATPAAEPAHPIVGGWAKATVTDTPVVAAAAFAVEAQEQALQASKNSHDPQHAQDVQEAQTGQAKPTRRNTAKPEHLKLLSVRSAEQQVVAGMNYRLQLSVQHNGKTRQAEALVWWQSWREPQPYQLTAWRWR